MLNDTWPHWLLIRGVVAVFRSIGPVSLIYTVRSVYIGWPQWPLASAGSYYVAAEACFFVGMLGYRRYLQRGIEPPPLWPRQRREALFSKVYYEMPDVERFLTGWLRGAKIEDVGRDEVRAWLVWAFWEGRATDEDAEELDVYVRKLEEKAGRQFEERRKNSAKSLRLTLDPVEMDWRSLAWYGIITVIDTVTHLSMERAGFRYFKTPATCVTTFPPRPLALIHPVRSPAKRITYWLKPHTSKTRLPILYIHGISAGLLAHFELLREINQAPANSNQDGDVGVLAIELPPLACRIAPSIPNRAEFLDEITQILDKHEEYKRFILVGHSYGSVFSNHILHHEPLVPRIAATFLIDPVSLMLYMPDVAYNFTTRPPRQANEWMLWFFASRDPEVSHVIGRHFFWTQNVLFRDRIAELMEGGMEFSISLSAGDLIVNAPDVGRYLMGDEFDATGPSTSERGQQVEMKPMAAPKSSVWKRTKGENEGLKMLWFNDLDHAEVLDLRDTRKELLGVLEEFQQK